MGFAVTNDKPIPAGAPEAAEVLHPPLVPPLIGDYATTCAQFSWTQARSWLGLSPGDRLNIGREAVDRQVEQGRGEVVALRFVAEDESTRELTYRQLMDETDRFAALLAELGVGPGERVSTLLGRVPELYVTALGTLKHGGVYCPLFAAFGPGPVRERLELGSVRVLVTTAEAYRRKVAPYRDELATLEHVLIIGAGEAPPGTLSWPAELARPRPPAALADTGPDDPALLHFTSGTTGKPKGAVHVHEAVVAHHATSRFVLDLHPEDVFWCTADPGWVTGTSYGIIGPLTRGVTVIVDEGEFDANRWYRILAAHAVTVWYTAPTAIRMLMRAGEDVPGRFDLSTLRHVISVGEPLNAEAVYWGMRAIGLPIHDTWWQTETGAIMVSNYPGAAIRPGSMGRPIPGVQATVLKRGEDDVVVVDDGHVRELHDPQAIGELALRPGWPSMFRDYLDEHERYEHAFVDGWYLTGDLVRRDDDGYFWFVGRGNDLIKSAGHLIGPFEVESALMEHPAVVEAGVIGKPDPIAGELVKAFVTLRPGFEPDDATRRDLIAFGRRRLGALAPREITFDQHLPHTRSGKVMRRLLKARELGLPEGDVSTVEATP